MRWDGGIKNDVLKTQRKRFDTDVHGSISHNNQKTEATQVFINV